MHFVKFTLLAGLAFAEDPWEKYNYSPKSRTLRPVRIHSSTDGCLGVIDDSGCDPAHSTTVPAPSKAGPLFPNTMTGHGASIVFDFGKNVGGITTLHLGEVSGGASAKLAWSESTYYISTGDNSNGGSGADGALGTGKLTSNTKWVTPTAKLRGGFRYLNVFLDQPGVTITINDISLQFTPAPAYENPSAYANHFYCDDELVNRVWYGAAYTVQMNTIDPNQGRVWGPPPTGWDNSGVCGVGKSVLVDGAKRDRVIWPGDMGVSTASLYYTTGDTASSLWALDTLYMHQTGSGMLPYAGPPVSFWGASDTYHLWALAGTGRLFQYTGNTTWMASHWEGFKSGVACSLRKVSSKDLMVVDQKNDWQRCCQGGENIAANSILYHVLDLGQTIAKAMEDLAVASEWATVAQNLATAINIHLWDEKKGAYKDNPASSLYPQDGNSLAVWFGIADSSQARAVSDYLYGNWGPYGSGSPEWGMNVGTFPGSMEVNAHAAAGNTHRALEMVRLQWGYMLNNPNSTESTFWEGYNKDGTFNFGGAYMSNAHGWATGAAEMLSTRLLGLRPISPGGGHYAVHPNPGGLRFCSGRLSFANGSVDINWQHHSTETGEERFILEIDARKHRDSKGEVEMPLFLKDSSAAHTPSMPSVILEGHGQVWPATSATALGSTGVLDAPHLSADGKRLAMVVPGGQNIRLIASFIKHIIV